MNHQSDFPIFKSSSDQPFVWLDSAASSQKPACVIAAMTDYYENHHANIHRGVHAQSLRATQKYENARVRAQKFINASDPREIIFVRGTTEAINLVAAGFAHSQLKQGDEIIVSEMEHHSNIVPWQMACKQTGATLRVIPVTDEGELDIAAYQKLLTEKTRLVAIAHVSNVLGTINPVSDIIRMAHEKNIPVLLDGAQAVSHIPVDVTELDCDFYVFSGHKMYGPTGIGVLYGKAERLTKLPPFQTGGGQIREVSFSGSTFADIPQKFEAGTPAIAEAVGLHAAMDYIDSIGVENIFAHEQMLLKKTSQALSEFSDLRILGRAHHKSAVISFVIHHVHAHDIATILDQSGVAVRAGHHCAMPLMQRFGVPATTRVSFGIYNTEADIEALVLGLKQALEIFQK